MDRQPCLHILAKDTKGNEFKKMVTIFQNSENKRVIVDFGWPIQYYFGDLKRHYPYKEPMSIDTCGMNHMGHQVLVAPVVMDKVVEWVEKQLKNGG